MHETDAGTTATKRHTATQNSMSTDAGTIAIHVAIMAKAKPRVLPILKKDRIIVSSKGSKARTITEQTKQPTAHNTTRVPPITTTRTADRITGKAIQRDADKNKSAITTLNGVTTITAVTTTDARKGKAKIGKDVTALRQKLLLQQHLSPITKAVLPNLSNALCAG